MSAPEVVKILVEKGHLLFWRGDEEIYHIPLQEFRDPALTASWWRQLAEKNWFTPLLNSAVARAVCNYLEAR